MSIPTLQIRKDDEHKFTVWATWPDGAFDAGFTSDQEADDWIANKFPIWL